MVRVHSTKETVAKMGNDSVRRGRFDGYLIARDFSMGPSLERKGGGNSLNAL